MKTLMLGICGAIAALAAPAEDGYVESLGQQFVNLRAFKTANTRIRLDFQTTYAFDDSYHYMLGTQGDKTGSWLAFYVDSNGHFYFKYGDGSSDAAFVKAAPYDTQRHTMEIALNENGSGRHRFIFTTGSTTNLNTTGNRACAKTTEFCPMMLFGCGWDYQNGEYAANRIPMKVYGVKIWEGNDLVHDYVPRKVEGRFYLKDLVDGKYVTGASRSDGKPLDELLTGGGDIVDDPGDAYIESHAHERIDLGIKADGTTRAELDHQLVAPTVWGEAYPFGARAMDGTSLTFWSYFAGNGGKLGYECVIGGPRWIYFNQIVKTGIVPAELRRTLIIDALNGKAAYETAGYECSSFEMTGNRDAETQGNLGLFAPIAGTGWGSGPAAMKFYGLDIYKNGTLVKSFRPYIKNALPGVIDQDGNFRTSSDDWLFCTNQQFKIGGTITGDAGMNDVYLETTGNEYIDTEVVPTANTKVVIDFAQTDPGAKNGGFLFGSRDTAQNGPYCWIGMDDWRLAAATDKTSWQFVADRWKLNMGRYVMTLDLKAKKATLRQGNTVFEKDLAAPNSLPTRTLALMGLHIEGGSITACSKIRLYSCKIYEDETCIRSYYPRRNDANGDICLYDSKQKLFHAPIQTKGMKLRGMTIDGVEQGFDQTPPANVTLHRGDSVTLTASAPFATSYVWRRNGIAIPGATGASYTIQSTDGRRRVKYSVSPVYTCNPIVGTEDRAVEGTPAETEVYFQTGLSLIVR